MSIQSLHLTLASAPALVMFHGSPEDRARRGTILFYHGFGKSKEAYETILTKPAEIGFLAVGIDGIGHGERRYRIGISGHSFGGCVTYAAVVADKRIGVAAPVVGSPQWKLPEPDSPHLHPDQFFPTALLSQTAAKDTNMLSGFARDLHRQLVPYYTQTPERLHYIEYPNSSHDLREEDWEQVWNAVARWFETFLTE